MNKRLEEIKERSIEIVDWGQEIDHEDLAWLIEQAERYDECKQDAMQLHKQNQAYKKALEEIKELTRYDDGTEKEVYDIATEALG